MRRLIAIFTIMSVLLAAFRASAEMRPFSLHDGRSVEAEIVGYNAKLGQVELKRMDGKSVLLSNLRHLG